LTNAVEAGKQINQTVIRLIRDDITDIEVDAFVFYAESDLALGTGFGGAIGVRGGPSIQKELDELAPVALGEAVVTAAGNLKAEKIIHAVGPKFQEEDTVSKLRTTVLSALKRADEEKVERLAFPAMGAGYYGIAPEVSAKVMLEAFRDHLGRESGMREVIICVLDTRQYNAFKTEIEA
jgi:O-acetyl-ADP-ribose deacetylase (regulator of RNase III)